MTESNRLQLGIMGAGSVGCFVGGKLAAQGEVDVTFVGREGLRAAIEAEGLTVTDLDGSKRVVPADAVRFDLTPEALAGCDVVFCCVKSAQTEGVAQQLAEILDDEAVVVSLQNGVRNPDTLRAHLGQTVLAGIVEFNAVWNGPAAFQRTTNGPLVVEAASQGAWRRTFGALKSAQVGIREEADVTQAQWTKLLVNLNNAISALSGVPTGEMVSSDYRFVVAAVAAEGIRVLEAASIRPGKFRGVPVRVMPKVLRLPRPLVRVLTRAQLKADPNARSSMWEDLSRGRKTEVDFLNGEIVTLAQQTGIQAPINERIVGLVREAEAAGQGPPNLSYRELSDRLGI